jgi:hypothetical protein
MDYDKKARYMFGIDYCSNHQGAKWLRQFAAEVLREVAGQADEFDDDNYEACSCGMKSAVFLKRRAREIEGGK